VSNHSLWHGRSETCNSDTLRRSCVPTLQAHHQPKPAPAGNWITPHDFESLDDHGASNLGLNAGESDEGQCALVGPWMWGGSVSAALKLALSWVRRHSCSLTRFENSILVISLFRVGPKPRSDLCHVCRPPFLTTMCPEGSTSGRMFG
jgi:hypothetical protein